VLHAPAAWPEAHACAVPAARQNSRNNVSFRAALKQGLLHQQQQQCILESLQPLLVSCYLFTNLPPVQQRQALNCVGAARAGEDNLLHLPCCTSAEHQRVTLQSYTQLNPHITPIETRGHTCAHCNLLHSPNHPHCTPHHTHSPENLRC
jgi:hypothetical protein